MVEIRITNISDKVNEKLVEQATKMGVTRNQYVKIKLGEIASGQLQPVTTNENKKI